MRKGLHSWPKFAIGKYFIFPIIPDYKAKELKLTGAAHFEIYLYLF